MLTSSCYTGSVYQQCIRSARNFIDLEGMRRFPSLLAVYVVHIQSVPRTKRGKHLIFLRSTYVQPVRARLKRSASNVSYTMYMYRYTRYQVWQDRRDRRVHFCTRVHQYNDHPYSSSCTKTFKLGTNTQQSIITQTKHGIILLLLRRMHNKSLRVRVVLILTAAWPCGVYEEGGCLTARRRESGRIEKKCARRPSYSKRCTTWISVRSLYSIPVAHTTRTYGSTWSTAVHSLKSSSSTTHVYILLYYSTVRTYRA